MSESRKGKIALSGLTKGASSSNFSKHSGFRFSPENEEIEEIMLQDPTSEESRNPITDSPKQSASGGSGGDTSPLKEMLKHKWANKWEKRSLSLDLDLKGKIITAIEDKRKSIVSHFIPEETGIIPPSISIPEHIGVTGQPPDNIVNGQNLNSMNIQSDSTSEGIGFLLENEDVEEIGLDYLANASQQEDSHLDNILKFNVSPEYLKECYGGFSPLYNQYPRNHNELPSPESVIEITNEDLKPATIFNNIFSALINHEWTKYVFCLIATALLIPLGFGSYFIAPILWVLVGGLSVIIFQESLCSNLNSQRISINTNNNDDDQSNQAIKTTAISPDLPGYQSSSPSSPVSSVLPILPTPETDRQLYRCSSRSQGWMTEFEGEYDPFTCNVRLTRIVFVRLEGSMLYISYPHPKHRIPKRRLWSDPVITTDHTFVRHSLYNIAGATVFIAPERLARKRAWNKKYPIAIRLPSLSVLATVSPSSSSDTLDSTNATDSEKPNTTSSTSASSSGNGNMEKKILEHKKEINREDCSHKVIYLFSRTDREKDDWYRRFVAATKQNLETPTENRSASTRDQSQEVLQEYLDYMRKIVPTLGIEKSSTLTPQTPKLESKSSDTKDSKEKDKTEKESSSWKKDVLDKSETSSTSSKLEDTPASSPRKGSPTLNLDDSLGLEKILTVPQSPDFLNAFLGRIFHDFLRSKYWTSQITGLIQKKLNYIHRPQFLDALIVKDLDLGTTIPIINRAATPIIDSQGLWINLDLSYDGNIIVTLETKLNLLKLRKSPSQETSEDSSSAQNSGNNSGSLSVSPSANFSNSMDSVSVLTKKQSQNSITIPGVSNHNNDDTTINTSNSSTPQQPIANMFDSDADDSGESSEDEMNPDDFLVTNDSSNKDDVQNSGDSSSTSGASSKGKKILKMAEKIASSKYVQQATDLKVVKKALTNVSNTPLVLSVELKNLMGTFALNIPPPPCDRLWMGFRHNPSMQISAKPKFGSRVVNLTHVTDWIQKKLLHEFQRVIVFPNMNDVTIPLMEFKLPN